MHQQHDTTTQPAHRSIQENTGSRGIQWPSVKVLQQSKTAPASVVQGVFTDADEVTLDMVAKYIGEKNKHMLGAFEAAATGSTSAGSIDTWLQTNLGANLSEVRSWHGERKEETSMELEPMAVSKDTGKASEKAEEKISLPNSQRILVGPKGYGVFNLFTFAGKQWIATAYHVVADIDGKYGKGEDAGPAFIIGNKWAGAVKQIMADNGDDYILYEITSPGINYPPIQLGAVNNDAPEELTVQTPRESKGVKITPQDVRKPREKQEGAAPKYMYANGRLRYIGETKGGDSGAAIVNASGQLVGLHQMDMGGMGFKKGQKVYDYLMQQKQ
jgi:trypsin-like peptidase